MTGGESESESGGVREGGGDGGGGIVVLRVGDERLISALVFSESAEARCYQKRPPGTLQAPTTAILVNLTSISDTTHTPTAESYEQGSAWTNGAVNSVRRDHRAPSPCPCLPPISFFT